MRPAGLPFPMSWHPWLLVLVCLVWRGSGTETSGAGTASSSGVARRLCGDRAQGVANVALVVPSCVAFDVTTGKVTRKRSYGCKGGALAALEQYRAARHALDAGGGQRHRLWLVDSGAPSAFEANQGLATLKDYLKDSCRESLNAVLVSGAFSEVSGVLISARTEPPVPVLTTTTHGAQFEEYAGELASHTACKVDATSGAEIDEHDDKIAFNASQVRLCDTLTRLFPSVEERAATVVALMRNIGWLWFAVVGHANLEGERFGKTIKHEVGEQTTHGEGLNVRAVELIEPLPDDCMNHADAHDESIIQAHEAFERIKETGTRVIVFALDADSHDTPCILHLASRAGLSGPGWMWVGLDWLQPNILSKFSAARQQLQESLDHAIAVTTNGADPKGVHAATDALINVLNPSELIANSLSVSLWQRGLSNYSPFEVPMSTFAEESYAEDCPNLDLACIEKKHRQRLLPRSAKYAHDAALAFQHAVCSLHKQAMPCNATHLPGAGAVAAAIRGIGRGKMGDPPLLHASSVTGDIVLDREGFRIGSRYFIAQMTRDVDRTAQMSEQLVIEPHLGSRDKAVSCGHSSKESDCKHPKLVVRALEGAGSLTFPGFAATPVDRAPVAEHELPIVFLLFELGLVSAITLGHVTEHVGLSDFLPESMLLILFGIVFGAIIRFTAPRELQHAVMFNEHFFVLILLPIIIFESAYALRKTLFLEHIWSILTYAVVGTIISTVIISLSIYSLGQSGSITPMLGAESFAYGAMISAVDPVATLSVFGSLGVDPLLNMIVYGESVINDAIAIVLYRSCVVFMTKPEGTTSDYMDGLVSFILTCVGSAACGCGAALFCSIILRIIGGDINGIDVGLMVLLSYVGFQLAEIATWSGILASLIGGLIAKHYAHRNFAPAAKRNALWLLRLLASLADSAVFFSVGLDIALLIEEIEWSLVLWSIALCLVGRFVAVFTLSYIINAVSLREWRPWVIYAASPGRPIPIPFNFSVIQCHAGLRGAIAYALAIDFPSQNRARIATTVSLVILFTIAGLGGTTTSMVKWWRVPRGMKGPKSSARVSHFEASGPDEDEAKEARSLPVREESPSVPAVGSDDVVRTRTGTVSLVDNIFSRVVLSGDARSDKIRDEKKRMEMTRLQTEAAAAATLRAANGSVGEEEEARTRTEFRGSIIMAMDSDHNAVTNNPLVTSVTQNPIADLNARA